MEIYLEQLWIAGGHSFTKWPDALAQRAFYMQK